MFDASVPGHHRSNEKHSRSEHYKDVERPHARLLKQCPGESDILPGGFQPAAIPLNKSFFDKGGHLILDLCDPSDHQSVYGDSGRGAAETCIRPADNRWAGPRSGWPEEPNMGFDPVHQGDTVCKGKMATAEYGMDYEVLVPKLHTLYDECGLLGQEFCAFVIISMMQG